MRIRRLIIPCLVLAMSACDDVFGPRDWTATPDTVVLFSASRPEFQGLPSAYDFTSLQPVVVEQLGATGFWDVVLAEDDGAAVFVPASAFPALGSRAAIARIDGATDLEDVREAPGDTAAFRSEAVPLEVGVVYVVRTRRDFCAELGSNGVRYAKLQPIEIDEVNGTLRFAVVRNPFCNIRELVPPDD